MESKIILGASVLLFLASFFVINSYDLSLNDIVTMPLDLLNSSVSGKAVPVFVFLLLQTAGLGLVGIFSLREKSNVNMWAMGSGVLSILSGLLFFEITNLIYLFYSMGLMLAIYVSAVYTPKFMDEYKVWRYYRTGSSVSKISILIVAVFISAGAYLEVASDPAAKEVFYDGLIDSLKGSISFDASAEDTPGYDSLTAEQKAALEKNIDEQNGAAEEQAELLIRQQIDASPIISGYVSNLALITALTVFSGMLLLRIVLVPLGGILSAAVLHLIERFRL